MRIRQLLFGATAFALFAHTAFAANPILRQKYTADPNPFVWNDRLYAYCSYDNNNPSSSGYDIMFYTLVSTDDMANWTDHGEVFSVKRDLSSYGQAYAPGVAVKNNKVYLYIPNGGSGIGVAAADRPEGPWSGGKSFISGNANNNTNVPWLFDPAGFVDSDGQGYIYFGGGPADGNPGPGQNLRVAKLNSDMMSAQWPATTISGSERSFEAAYMHKYNNTYYFSYSQNFTNGSANIAYMTGNSPMGPFKFQGTMLPNSASGGGNNHAGVVQYKNNWYIFYHDRKLRQTNGVSSGEYRSVSVDKLEYNTDGTIKQVTATNDGPAQIKNFNPYDTVLATTMYKQSGAIKTAICSAPNPGTISNSNKDSPGTAGDRNVMLVSIANNSWVSLKSVDFGTTGAVKFYASVASSSAGGSIEIRTGSNTGALAGTCAVGATGGITTWKNIECDVSSLSGVKDLYLVFKTSGTTEQFRVRWYKFSGSSAPVVVNPDDNGYYFYHNYEDGTAQDWTGRGDAKVANTNAQKANGSRSLAVTGRTGSWNGAAYSLNANAFVPGKEYSFSVLAMYPAVAGAPETDNFKFTLQYDLRDTARYEEIATAAAKAGAWVMLENKSFMIPAGATNLLIYVEMPDNETADFYIDDAMGGVKGTAAPGRGGVTTSIHAGTTVRGQSQFITFRARTLTVNASPDSKVRVRVVDLTGRTAAAFKSTGGASFSLRKIPAGTYMVEAVRDGRKSLSTITLR